MHAHAHSAYYDALFFVFDKCDDLLSLFVLLLEIIKKMIKVFACGVGFYI